MLTKNIVNTSIFPSGRCLPWHYPSQPLPEHPLRVWGNVWLCSAWHVQFILASGRNGSFGHSEQTGRHPKDSAAVINATRNRVWHLLYPFLNLRKKTVWKWTLSHETCPLSKKQGLLNTLFLALVKNDAGLGPHFTATTTLFSCCSWYCFCPFVCFSVKPDSWGTKSALSFNTGLSSVLRAQRAGVKTWKDNHRIIQVGKNLPAHRVQLFPSTPGPH